MCRFADSLANSSESIASTTSATPGSGRSVGDMSEVSSAADGAEYAMKQAALAAGNVRGPQAWPSGITASLYLQIGDQTQTVPQAPQIVLPPGADGSTCAAQEATCNEEVELEEEEEENELQQQETETQPQEQPAPEESNGSGTWHAAAADGDLNGNESNAIANESDANEELADERDEPDFQDEDDGHMIIHRGQIIARKCMPIIS